MEILILTLVIVAAGVAVGAPVLRLRGAGAGAPRPAVPPLDDAGLDREVRRYREALRAGTVCTRCRYANPAGSRYCADCGKRLPGT